MRRRNDLDHIVRHTQSFSEGGKLYKTLVSIAIGGVFLAAGILTLGFTGTFKLSAWLFGVVGMIAILCLGLVSILPWIRKIEKGEFKKVAITFICVIAACALLWIVCDWLLVAIFKNPTAGSATALFWFVKFAIILSLQLMVADIIAAFRLKYGNSFLPFQIITYCSYAFIDFYFTFLLVCVNLIGDKLEVSPAFAFLGNQFMITLVALAFVYAIISSSIIKRVEGRRMRNAADEYHTIEVKEEIEAQEAAEAEKTAEESTEDKLAKIKKLYEQELITKEEYEQKKSDLLKDI